MESPLDLMEFKMPLAASMSHCFHRFYQNSLCSSGVSTHESPTCRAAQCTDERGGKVQFLGTQVKQGAAEIQSFAHGHGAGDRHEAALCTHQPFQDSDHS